MTRFTNLTPHNVNLHGTGMSIPPIGVEARCITSEFDIKTLDLDIKKNAVWRSCAQRFPVKKVEMGAVVMVMDDGRPASHNLLQKKKGALAAMREWDSDEPDPDHYFIVSRVVADALPRRTNILFPNDIVRTKKGRIIGCRSFAMSGVTT